MEQSAQNASVEIEEATELVRCEIKRSTSQTNSSQEQRLKTSQVLTLAEQRPVR